MQPFLLLLSCLCLALSQIRAQVLEPPRRGLSAAEVGIFDPLAIERQLFVAPKALPVPIVPAPAPVPAAPGQVVKTTKSTTTVKTPGQPTRIYESERSIVLVQDQNQIRELPYITLPVLFVRETADLLDARSRAALEQLASVMRTVCVAEPKALFDIEGHTSTDGMPEFNVTLSIARAQRVYDELTMRYGVPASVLTAHGYGSRFAMHPNSTEEEMQLDRRVLVVRTR